MLEDALNQVVGRPHELKKPLRVTFISQGVDEEGLDQGGVKKEFFQLLTREIFNEVMLNRYLTPTFSLSHPIAAGGSQIRGLFGDQYHAVVVTRGCCCGGCPAFVVALEALLTCKISTR